MDHKNCKKEAYNWFKKKSKEVSNEDDLIQKMISKYGQKRKRCLKTLGGIPLTKMIVAAGGEQLA